MASDVSGGDTGGLMVGRAVEFGVLEGLVADLGAGRGRCVVVQGEPGIGKTVLVEAGLALARRGAGFDVASIACDELGQQFPLAVLLEALGVDHRSPDRVRAEAAAAISGLAGPQRSSQGWSVSMVSGDPVRAAAEQIMVLVDRLCAVGPLVLAADDLQWADEASLMVWQRLCRATTQLPLLLVGAYRPVPRRMELDRVRREVRTRGGILLALDRLGPADVAAQVSRLAGATPGPALADRLELAGGNPLYVQELVGAYTRIGAIHVVGGILEFVETELSGVLDGQGKDGGLMSLAAVIADRLDFLASDTHEVLRTAVLLGSDFAVTDLSTVLNRSAAALSGPVEEAIAAGVLETAGSRLRFRHGLIKQALYEAIPASLRTALFQEAARALAAAGAPTERVAALILTAEVIGSWEATWIADNAPGLARRAPSVAAVLLEQALAHTAQVDPSYSLMQDQLAAVLMDLSRYEQCEQVCREILSGTGDPQRRAQAVWFLSYTLYRGGRSREAAELIEAVSAEPGTSRLWQARLATRLAVTALATGHNVDAERAATRALAEGKLLADRTTVAHALQAKSVVRWVEHDMTGALSLMNQEQEAIGGDTGLIDLRLNLVLNQFAVLMVLGRFDELDVLTRAGRDLAEQAASPKLLNFILRGAEAAMIRGKWDDALAELEAAADPTFESYPLRLAGDLYGIKAYIAAHRDDQRTAARYLQAAARAGYHVVNPIDSKISQYLLLAEAMLAERRGQIERAVATMAVLLDPELSPMQDLTSLLPLLVRLALECGDECMAHAAAVACTARARSQPPLASEVALREWCTGLVDDDLTALLTASDYYRGARLPLALGNILEDAAVVSARAGAVDGARAALSEALVAYDELGAVWDARRAAMRLRSLGIRPGARRARRRPATGRAALTATELRVAALVAQGGSNPDIATELLLSRRTIETHVSHILTKLQLTSRHEVAKHIIPAS
jgi:DNA-binding CsgD family transcriptional regulator